MFAFGKAASRRRRFRWLSIRLGKHSGRQSRGEITRLTMSVKRSSTVLPVSSRTAFFGDGQEEQRMMKLVMKASVGVAIAAMACTSVSAEAVSIKVSDLNLSDPAQMQ